MSGGVACGLTLGLWYGIGVGIGLAAVYLFVTVIEGLL